MNEDTPAVQLYQLLLCIYADSAVSESARKQYEEILKEYTLEIMQATTATLLKGLDIEDTEVHVVQITEAQRHALIASDTLDLYIAGKDTMDD